MHLVTLTYERFSPDLVRGQPWSAILASRPAYAESGTDSGFERNALHDAPEEFVDIGFRCLLRAVVYLLSPTSAPEAG